MQAEINPSIITRFLNGERGINLATIDRTAGVLGLELQGIPQATQGKIALPAILYRRGRTERRTTMGVFRRRYPDGRLSKDWHIDYRIAG